MQYYLVGGALRNQLLGLPVKERDWVVVGGTAKELLAKGYRQVGHNFPVFLHPDTHEEYALARTERKVGHGHRGFICLSSPEVTLIEDLSRRDLTINAMAQADDGTLIDPFNGQRDLKERWLRHVSPSFIEDPLRVLRVARFAAYFGQLGFKVAPETLQLMRDMASTAELNHLTAERVWKETEKALCSQAPQLYFSTLKDCNALPILFPELNDLFGVPAPAQWHPEIDTGIHSLLALEQSAQLSNDLDVRFAVLCHDFGKALTPKSMWPHHPHHGDTAIPIINKFCVRLKVPNRLKVMAQLMARVHGSIHRAQQLSPENLLQLFYTIDVWRKPKRLQQLIVACTADLRGRQGYSSAKYPAGDYLRQIYEKLANIRIINDPQNPLAGEKIKSLLWQKRLWVMQQCK